MRPFIAIIYLIYQINAQYIIESVYLLPYLSYTFRCALHHPHTELCITCSKLSAFYKVVTKVTTL
jgi:hypothetical protein